MDIDQRSQGEIIADENNNIIHTNDNTIQEVHESPPRKIRREVHSRVAVIETSDGVRIEVNSFELSRHSRFFRAFFYGPMSKTHNGGVYRLSTVNSKMLQTCIDFLSRLDSLKPENTDLMTACLVLDSASYLCLIKLENKLSSLICSLVDPVNVISIYAKVEDISPSLARRLWDKIVADFEKLIENRSYLALTENEMIKIVEDENLDIQQKNEKAFVNEWCKHRPEEEKAKLIEVTEALQTIDKDYSQDGYIVYKKRYPRSIVLSIGGWSSEGVTNAIEVYSTRSNSWKNAKPETRMVPLSYHGLIQRKEGLYVIGGFNGHNYFNSNHFYHFNDQKWSILPNMRSNRSYVSVVNLGMESNHFVALGGFSGAERLSSVEMYDVEKGMWKGLQSMNKARSDGSAVNIDERIIAIGGFDGSTIHNTVEIFDFHRQKWDILPSHMHSMRTGVTSLALSRSVFSVFGGFNSQKRLKSVELYDTREGKWHLMNEMKTTRSNFSVELYNNRIIAAGGYDGGRTTNAVESFDIRINRWADLPALVIPKSALKITRIDDLDVIRSFSFAY